MTNIEVLDPTRPILIREINLAQDETFDRIKERLENGLQDIDPLRMAIENPAEFAFRTVHIPADGFYVDPETQRQVSLEETINNIFRYGADRVSNFEHPLYISKTLFSGWLTPDPNKLQLDRSVSMIFQRWGEYLELVGCIILKWDL